MAARDYRIRAGVTLLELILALSLSVVLLFAVGMSLRLYWRSFDAKRTNVEQAHLARAVLRKMEDDLRSAIQYTPVDLSGLESMASASSLAGAMAGMTSPGTPGATPGGGSTAGSAGSSGGASGGATGSTPMGSSSGGGASTTPPTTSQSGQGASGGASSSGATKSGSATTGGTSGAPSTGASASGGASTGGAAATSQSSGADPAAAEATEETPPPVIGLYGSATQIQFDVSRLPRVDEYGTGSPASMVQIPSDIKTVTYYVRSETSEGSGTISTFGSGTSNSPAAGSSEPSTTGQGRGLMRLEMDRAVSAYGASGGGTTSGYEGAKLLASEVTSVAFRYWDGTDWVSDWNSDEMGGLPLAVEIVMTMSDANAEPTGPPVQSFGPSATASTEPTYRIVVSLPTASLPPPPAEEPATETDPAATGGTTSTGGTGASTTKGAGGAPPTSGSTSSFGSTPSGSSGGGSSSYGTGAKTGGSK